MNDNKSSEEESRTTLLGTSPISSDLRTKLPSSMKILQNKNFFPAVAPADVAKASTVNLPSTISTQPKAPPQLHNDSTTTRTVPTSSSSQNYEVSSSSSSSSSNLAAKLTGDVLVAVTVTFGVSPFLTVVDKAIVESAAGTKTLLVSGVDSIKSMARHPIQYFKSPTFLLMWAVYSSTYTTANSFKTIEEHQRQRSAVAKSQGSPSFQLGKVGTFLGTTFVNSGASIMKDRAYARMFSSQSAKQAVTPQSFPKTTYMMWMMRDFSVIGSSFILPDIVSSKMVEMYGIEQSKAQSISQLTLPVMAQFVAGPFHYLGLDFYNRQGLNNLTMANAIKDRCRQLYSGIGPVIGARIARIAPGYGIGGVWNTKLRNAWRDDLVQRQEKRYEQRLPSSYQQPIQLIGNGKEYIGQLTSVVFFGTTKATSVRNIS
jgi:hypothetical protein